MRQSLCHLALLLAVLPVLLRAEPKAQPVAGMDIARYAGVWYEIARFPNRFQKQCAGDVTANYSLLPEGRVQVVNKCRLADGSHESATAVARQADPSLPNTVLKVRFAPEWLSWLSFVWADYWVIALDPDYQHALVGTPDHDYLWILSRTPTLGDVAYEALVATARAQGYEVRRLQKTVQGAP